MADESLPQLGGLSPSDCPEYFPKSCYSPCDHVTETLLDYYNFENYQNSPRHLALIKALLNRQDAFIQDICTFDLDLCTRGLFAGFPCVQCGYVCRRGFSLCVGDTLQCGSSDYLVVESCYSCDVSICDDKVISEFDFTSTPDLVELYGRIIEALELNVNANISGVSAVVKAIFDMNAEVVNYVKNTFYIWLGRDATDEERKLWPIIQKALPLPVGVNATLINLS